MSAEETQLFLAKALYDNMAETSDELTFRRGDVLTVLEQDTAGLEGWWLCSLRGRQGIAPGNRLKILSGMLDGSSGVPVFKDEWQRRSLEHASNKVTAPGSQPDTSQYSQPPPPHALRTMEDYDVPPTRLYPGKGLGSDTYDVPTSLPVHSPNASFYDTPPSSKRASSERTPPGSQRASMDSLGSASSLTCRLSGDQGPQSFYQTPPSSKRASAESGNIRISGGEGHYDTPPSSKRSSLERILSDDQPTYDTPQPGRGVEVLGQATYDTPTSGSRRHSRESTGACSRGSVLSNTSIESGMGGSSCHLASSRHSGAASLDSARSSLDASLHDPLDPPAREARTLKQLSMDSGLGSFYDTPAPGCQNQAPHLVHSASQQLDCGKAERTKVDIKRSRSLENALDDFYDSPRNNTPKVGLKSGVQGFSSSMDVNHDPHALYDIPPQVTRDSVISARSDSSDDSLRLSTCSMDSRGSGSEYAAVAEGIYEELLLDLDSAVELLVKVQQDFTHCASRVLTFVTPTWRTKESLQTHVYDLKVSCTHLKRALGQFLEFAQGTLANSARLTDRKLARRLVRHVTPLQQHRKVLSQALHALEDMKWQVALLMEPLELGTPDPLGKVISVTQELVPDVKKVASLIQGNSTLLFRRSSELAVQSRGSDQAAKPPLRPKPELQPKPGSGVGIIIPRARTVQQRPLPAPPLSRRPLPPTPLQQKMKSLDISASQDSLNADYVNVTEDGPRRYAVADDDDDDGDRDYSDLQQEYDYVQLEESDAEAQQRKIDEQHRRQQQLMQEQQQQQQQHHQQTQQQEQHHAQQQQLLQQQHQQQQNQQLQEKHQQQQPQLQPTLRNIAEDAEPPIIPRKEKNQFCVELGDQDSPSSEPKMKPEPVKHIDRMSADFCKKLLDIDLVPTKEDFNEAISSPDIPDSPGPKAEPAVDSCTSINGVRIPSHLPNPSGSLNLSGRTLDPSDKQVLCYYSGQLETHCTLLTNAIDAFFACVQNKEPPKVFISNSKFVIVTAHKLVYMGDALHRSLLNEAVRERVLQCAEHVCQSLKVSVQATKTAALQYPSPPAMQDMVDCLVDVSHAAHELKLVITQASAL